MKKVRVIEKARSGNQLWRPPLGLMARVERVDLMVRIARERAAIEYDVARYVRAGR